MGGITSAILPVSFPPPPVSCSLHSSPSPFSQAPLVLLLLQWRLVKSHWMCPYFLHLELPWFHSPWSRHQRVRQVVQLDELAAAETGSSQAAWGICSLLGICIFCRLAPTQNGVPEPGIKIPRNQLSCQGWKCPPRQKRKQYRTFRCGCSALYFMSQF